MNILFRLSFSTYNRKRQEQDIASCSQPEEDGHQSEIDK
jgi:hypothetical protein